MDEFRDKKRCQIKGGFLAGISSTLIENDMVWAHSGDRRTATNDVDRVPGAPTWRAFAVTPIARAAFRATLTQGPRSWEEKVQRVTQGHEVRNRIVVQMRGRLK